MDIYTIIFLALAVFIFLRLRSVLGQRTGSERPPYDRPARDVLQGRGGDASRGDNVVPIPGTIIDQAPLAPADPAPTSERWKGTAEPGSDLARGLDGIAKEDSSFDPKHFVAGAKGAYEMIVMAFAQGDRRTLKDLLSPEVFESFDGAIREREQRGERMERKFVGIDKAEIVGADLRGRVASLTVRFVSQMISVTSDKAGAVVDGSPESITDVTDVWTFSRDMASRDPNWRLVGTEGGQ
ncbi:Tim44/TimA family putative adaptor protein [Bradyrhizobium sp. LHD-71]|uniref:Tim44/TimA family putative adaptor protein n=1 Tax=Bradyrhizobium sp. LHD-71 TaxID=3072141 RepID=UPI00280DE107|nr:Tim44/TimA family putative adaptor protein [Bradyrhizobium sp. LHD-71]MDQ8732651.1 Tim44/TimA family putative adaptor protein [Bradyrhizobium sp. LHD-71]